MLSRCIRPATFALKVITNSKTESSLKISSNWSSSPAKHKVHSHSPGNVQSNIHDHGNRLEVTLPRWPHSLNLSYVWLRDHCRCPLCYNTRTSQRINDVYNIPLSIRPAAVNSTEGGIVINWPDGHDSQYDYKFLWMHTAEGGASKLKKCLPKLWTQKSFPALENITVPLDKILESQDGQFELMNAILQYGVGFVSKVSPTVEATRKVVEKLCSVKKTFYGEMWAFQADEAKADLAYSNEYLGTHTDATYFSEVCRIQVFHAIQEAERGGETLLVDGFNIAKQFKERNPEGYDFLSSCYVPAEYIGDNQHYKALDVVFKHDPCSRELRQFRYNLYDRAPLSTLPFNKVEKYYQHIKDLTSLVRNPSNEISLKLLPGQVIFLDNWRVMHGRNTYSGPRVIGGCYLDNSDFESKARVLGFDLD